MPICRQCNERFPNAAWIDGKKKHLGSRKYCLNCSPYNQFTLKRGPKPNDSGHRKGIVLEHTCPICNRKHSNKNLQRVCSTCRSKKRRDDVKKKLIEYKGGRCQTCGYNKNRAVLEFHHLDEEQKDFNISASLTELDFEKVKREVDKCVLLCANCHRELHYPERKDGWDLYTKSTAQYHTDGTRIKFPSIKYSAEEITNKLVNNSLSQVAREIDVDKKTLRSFIDHHNISYVNYNYRKPKKFDPTKEQLEQWLKEKTKHQISIDEDIDCKAIDKRIKQLGIDWKLIKSQKKNK